jgi:RNA polymerase sigma-70 factor, ECF subfamily
MDRTSPTLLARLRQLDNAEAWQKFMQLYYPLLSRWADCLARKWHLDANDVLSEVMLCLVQDLPHFTYNREQGRFRGWLRSVLTNKAKDWLRRENRFPDTGRELSFEECSDPDVARLFEKQDYNHYLVRRARQVMERDFPASTWQQVLANVVDEKPAAEVAALFGTTVDAVYAARYRVLRRLRKELEGLLEE